MKQAEGISTAQEQHRHIASLKIALLYEGVAYPAGVHYETIHLSILLRGAFDYFHTVQRLSQMCVHRTKRGTDFIGDRCKCFQVANQKEEVEQNKNDRRENKRWMVTPGDKDRHQDENK